jgi:hypothetical protein
MITGQKKYDFYKMGALAEEELNSFVRARPKRDVWELLNDNI